MKKIEIKKVILRNKLTREGNLAKKDQINLEYYRDDVNLGDDLSSVVIDYMLSLKGISTETKTRKPYTHLMAIGSIIGGRGLADATVWGSGVRSFSEVARLGKSRYIQRLDIRLVRGPVTRQIVMQAGHYFCPELYGDPAVLMPLIYTVHTQKTDKIALVSHFLSNDTFDDSLKDTIEVVDIKTKDYMSFIDSISKCKMVISSSLHGIILAETYGVPAVFLGKGRESEFLKYYDWYYSTGRYGVKVASSIEEAMSEDPMPLPDLGNMRKVLLEAFPYDLWI